MLRDETLSVHDIHSDANVIPASTHETPEDWFAWLDSIYAAEQPLSEAELEELATASRDIPLLMPITTPVHRIDPTIFNPAA